MNDTVTLPPLLFFDPERAGKREKRVRTKVKVQTRHEPRLLCAACRHVVTYPIQRTTAHGGHEHTCTNPHGITYRIGCFREACGCVPVGESTQEFTWFAGYVWRIVLCAGCQAHLGWRFESSADRFYGLILERLVLEQPSERGSDGG